MNFRNSALTTSKHYSYISSKTVISLRLICTCGGGQYIRAVTN